MKIVRKGARKVKGRKWLAAKTKGLSLGLENMNSKIELIQSLIPLGLMYVNEELQKEVKKLAGKRYARGINSRWGSQGGSIYLLDQKISIRVPRVRNKMRDEEVTLQMYKKLQDPRKEDEGLLKRVISGLSCRRYEECAETLPGVFGISGSTISRRYIRASAKKLREMRDRRLDRHDIVGIFLDGKTFSDDMMIMAIGVTIKGEKIILGFIQTGTENERVCREFLEELKDRGLKDENGILFVIDGSKGIRKAIEIVFKERGFVQRCQWHKRQNVISYLPKSQQDEIRRKLQNAYEEKTYKEAKESLMEIRDELLEINESAARSLDEGLEETLTLHKFGVFEELGISFKTTNCIESVMAQIGQLTDKVDYWRNSRQKHRWIATALLDIEPRLRSQT